MRKIFLSIIMVCVLFGVVVVKEKNIEYEKYFMNLSIKNFVNDFSFEAKVVDNVSEFYYSDNLECSIIFDGGHSKISIWEKVDRDISEYFIIIKVNKIYFLFSQHSNSCFTSLQDAIEASKRGTTMDLNWEYLRS